MNLPALDPARGVYGISVAAELVGMGAQKLRLYERRGLLEPDRTDGGTRRYSSDDLDRLRRIGELLASGLNLTSIALVLDLEADNNRLRAEIADLAGAADRDSRSTRAVTTGRAAGTTHPAVRGRSGR